MFTDAQSKELFERVLDRMVENGWLENYTFTSGKGFCLGWTVGGAEKAVCLKEIATVYRLTENDQAPLLFDKLAHRQPVLDSVRGIHIEPALAGYWKEWIDELELSGDEDGLLALVPIVIMWAPDAETPIRLKQ